MLPDFPQFWTPAEGEGPGSNVELGASCDIFEFALLLPDAVATEASVEYQGPGERRAASLAAVLRTEGEAQDALASIDDTVQRCRPELIEAIREGARQEAADRGYDLGPFTDINVDLSDRDFASLGDGTLAYRAHVEISVAGIGTEYTLDVVLIQEGHVIGGLTYANFGDLEEDEELELAEVLAAKLAAADASLP